jgi:hypothetical protein
VRHGDAFFLQPGLAAPHALDALQDLLFLGRKLSPVLGMARLGA